MNFYPVDKASVSRVRDQLYSAIQGLDYEQPTSLGSDLDELAKVIIEEFLTDSESEEKYEPSVKTDILREVLEECASDYPKIEELLEALDEVAEILGNVEYGGLGDEDARALEEATEQFTNSMEEFLDELE